MITSQKIKLLINDPKFRQVQEWNTNSMQQALNKIYANEKQIHRSKVVQECLIKNENVNNVDTTVDFLQSKIKAVQQKIVQDIQNTLSQKQRIQDKYKQLEDIFDKANKKYLRLVTNMSPELNFEKNVQKIQKEIKEIKQIYEQNLLLKNTNNQIKKRINSNALKRLLLAFIEKKTPKRFPAGIKIQKNQPRLKI